MVVVVETVAGENIQLIMFLLLVLLRTVGMIHHNLFLLNFEKRREGREVFSRAGVIIVAIRSTRKDMGTLRRRATYSTGPGGGLDAGANRFICEFCTNPH